MNRSDLLDMVPPAPYELVCYDKIEKGDMFRWLGEREWRPADENLVGKRVMHDAFAIARINPPDLYRLACPDEPISPRDLIWVDEELGWMPLNELPSVFGRFRQLPFKVSEIISWLEQHDKVVHYVKIDETSDDPRVVEIPAGHLELQPGDIMSLGDFVVHQGIKKWIPVSEYLTGSRVQEFGWTNGYSRVCRPVRKHLADQKQDREKRMKAEMFKSKG